MKLKDKDIKMIACDIDGTLIPYGKTELPEKIFELIDDLCKKGIHFIIASGRAERNLKKLFEPVASKISFICGNGSIYVEQDKIVFTQPFERDMIHNILEEFHKDENLIPVIMCEDSLYVQVTGSEKEKQEKRLYISGILRDAYTEIENLDEIFTPICKLGVYQYEIMPEEQVEMLRAKWPDAIFVCGGGSWLDVTDRNTNKGTALSKILKNHHLTPKQLMVFGDNENDIEMLSLAEYSYVMTDGAAKAKEAAKYECINVLEIMREFLG